MTVLHKMKESHFLFLFEGGGVGRFIIYPIMLIISIRFCIGCKPVIMVRGQISQAITLIQERGIIVY